MTLAPAVRDRLSGKAVDGQAAQSLPAAAKETRTMNEQRFPEGWDEQRVKRLIAELDACAADEAAAADDSDQAVITVPVTLLPEIRRLLASHKTANRQNVAPGRSGKLAH
jgi:hypothetical protein